MTDKKEAKCCYFCVNKVDYIDYKETEFLRKYVNIYKKILPRRRTGTCAWHQRKLAMAVKRSRMMALLPFTNR